MNQPTKRIRVSAMLYDVGEARYVPTADDLIRWSMFHPHADIEPLGDGKFMVNQSAMISPWGHAVDLGLGFTCEVVWDEPDLESLGITNVRINQ